MCVTQRNEERACFQRQQLARQVLSSGTWHWGSASSKDCVVKGHEFGLRLKLPERSSSSHSCGRLTAEWLRAWAVIATVPGSAIASDNIDLRTSRTALAREQVRVYVDGEPMAAAHRTLTCLRGSVS
jgi:hypothetical protein